VGWSSGGGWVIGVCRFVSCGMMQGRPGKEEEGFSELQGNNHPRCRAVTRSSSDREKWWGVYFLRVGVGGLIWKNKVDWKVGKAGEKNNYLQSGPME